jgi:hypothetical protein
MSPIHALCRRIAAAFAATVFVCAASSQPADSLCASSTRGIPERAPDARGASALIQALAGMNEHERDRAVRAELLAGNTPAFLRQAKPVGVVAPLPGRDTVHLTLCVLPDYLSIGSDDDFLLVPMGLSTALAVAGRFGFTLPTRHIVDLIYQASAARLAPQPLPAGDSMRSTDYVRWHQRLVQAQRSAIGAAWGRLTAGHKKDLVLTPRLWGQPGRVAIYGWHRAVGAPIQPLSTVHGAQYADYSHGVRLVSEVVFVDGHPRSIYELLADPRLASLISDEGPIPRAAELREGAAPALLAQAADR